MPPFFAPGTAPRPALSRRHAALRPCAGGWIFAIPFAFITFVFSGAVSIPALAQPDGLLLGPVDAQEGAVRLYNQRAEAAAAIDAGSLGRLSPAWVFKTDHPVSHTPLPAGDRVYVADWGGTVYALDRQSGTIIWQNKVQKPNMQWPWHGFAGTGALGNGVLVQASVEGKAYGLDPETGGLLWSTRIADDKQAGSISTLLIHQGKVFIGLSSVEEPLTKMRKGFTPDFQGKVLALDVTTGETVWETPLVEPPQNGVAVWSSFALDPGMNALFFTTGNNYTGEASPLSDSIIAVDAGTGRIIWSHQTVQHDVWTPASPEGPDYDFGGGAQLFEANIDGQRRKLVGAGSKSGFYHVLDRQTGTPIWTTSIGYGGVDGGIHGEASIIGDRILVWSNNGYHHTQPPTKHPISVKALDAATGRQLWVRDQPQPAALYMGGYAAGDAYFVGSLDGKVRGYDIGTGKTLWTSQNHGPVASSIWVDEDMLFFSAAAPKMFEKWAKGSSGVVAYGLRDSPDVAGAER